MVTLIYFDISVAMWLLLMLFVVIIAIVVGGFLYIRENRPTRGGDHTTGGLGADAYY